MAATCPLCQANIKAGATFCPECWRIYWPPPDLPTPTALRAYGQRPFYERWPVALHLPVWLGPPLLSASLLGGLGVLGWFIQVDLLADWTWFLCLIIGVVMLLLIWATPQFRIFANSLGQALSIPKARSLRVRVGRCLADRRMFAFAAAFGLINLAMGLAYGIWHRHPAAIGALCVLYLLAGGVCGLAVNGIVAILAMVRRACRVGPRPLSLLHPDGCAGTAILGRHLLFFSGISLIAGVLIGLYIVKAPWAHSHWPLVQWARYFWIGFPHLAALSLLLLPLVSLHRLLRDTKAHTELLLLARMQDIQHEMGRLQNASTSAALQHYLLGAAVWQHLSQFAASARNLREWPFDRESSLRYALSFIISGIPPSIELLRLLGAAHKG